VVSCLILVSIVSRTSTAAEPDRARAKAVRLAAEGTAAYKAEDFALAIRKFTDAYKTFPAPPLLLNLSRAELKLNRCKEAIRDAELFKDAAPEARSASDDSPDAWLATVQRTCIEAEIHSTPEGAAIWIDGERQSAPDQTPWTGRLPVGAHKVLLFLAGTGKREGTLTVSSSTPASLTIAFSDAPPPAPPAATRPAVQQPLSLTPVPAHPPRELRADATSPAPVPRNVGYAAVAIGAAALGAAVLLEVTAVSDSMALTRFPPTPRTTAMADAQLGSVNGRLTAADALFGVGGAVAVTGVALSVVF
jgi:hypothetical protein